MALFNKKSETDTSDKTEKLMQKYGLQDVDPKYADTLQKISAHLAGAGLGEFGGMLSNDDKAVNRAQTQYTHAILEQNFIIIRQLDDLIKIMKNK